MSARGSSFSAARLVAFASIVGAVSCAGSDQPPVGAWPASDAAAASPPSETTGAWRARYDVTLEGAPWTPDLGVTSLGPTDDGGLLAVGPTLTRRGMLGLTLDGDGAVRSAWGFHFDASELAPLDLPMVSRGAVVAVGSESHPSSPKLFALTILEIGADGGLRKNTRIDTGIYNRNPMAMRTADGGTLVVAGSLLVKLAADGAPSWSRVYAVDGHEEIIARMPLEVADGFVVAFHDLGVPYLRAMMLAHLSPSGEITWARTIAVRNDAGNAPTGILLGDDGRIVACVGLGTGAPVALVSLAADGSEGTAREIEMSLHASYTAGVYAHGNPGYLQRAPDGYRCGVRGDGIVGGDAWEGVGLELRPDGSMVRATRDRAALATTLPDGSAVLAREGLGGPWLRLDHPQRADACAPPVEATSGPAKPVVVAGLAMTSTARTATRLPPLIVSSFAVAATRTAEQCW